MEYFNTRQIVMFVIALLIGGALTAWGTVVLVQRFVSEDPNDPLAKQGGLSPAQSIQKKR